MRILWFSTNSANYISTQTCSGGYNGGGWMSSLQNELENIDSVNLAICFCKDGEPSMVEQNGTIYYPVANHIKSKKDKILDLIHYNDVRRDEIRWKHYIESYKNVIKDFKPDVIEVFGSELYIGLATIAAKEMNIPCVLHIQGLLSLYIYTFLTPGVSKWSYYMSKGFKGIYSNFQYLTYWKRSCYREKAILNAVDHVIGRTDWDRQALEILNPKAKYHYGGEILRPVFYDKAERKIPNIPTITTTISFPLYKGYDLILKTANILKNEMGMDYQWNIYGNVDTSFIEKNTGLSHKDLNINLCGVASAQQLCDALLNSMLYFHSSYVENSSNSVAEAHMLGIPVVATNVGGTADMVEDKKSGFLFPSTDPYMAAYYISQLIKNKDLNIQMGKVGMEIARQRHNKQNIVEELINLYKEIM